MRKLKVFESSKRGSGIFLFGQMRFEGFQHGKVVGRDAGFKTTCDNKFKT